MTIGIPRALFYYYYPRLWESFFHSIGMEIILSAPTSTKTIEKSALLSETDNCLPVKLLDAHIESLVDKVDTILVPRIHSMIKGRVSCPKFGALPDVAQANLRGRLRVLVVTVDENRETMLETLTGLGISLGVARKNSKQAARLAIEVMQQQRRQLNVDSTSALDGQPRVMLLSHPYILLDDYLSGPVRRKLTEMNIAVLARPFPPPDTSTRLSAWDTCSSMHQSLLDLKPETVNGIIHLSSFNCGCDSIMVEFYREILETKRIRYMVLVMDEHTAQAGVDTRIEAFADSMGW